jgi:hypothetical protein
MSIYRPHYYSVLEPADEGENVAIAAVTPRPRKRSIRSPLIPWLTIM